MLVHLVGSVDSTEDTQYLQSIIKAIHELDSTLSLNWVDPAILQQKTDSKSRDWASFVRLNMEALEKSDVVIVDATHYTFSQGFQMMAALEHNKPTLVVSRQSLDHLYITGLPHHLLTVQGKVKEDAVYEAAYSFMRKNVVHTKDLRFNMFLTKEIVQYLDNSFYTTGVNRSQLIRNLIRKASERQGE